MSLRDSHLAAYRHVANAPTRAVHPLIARHRSGDRTHSGTLFVTHPRLSEVSEDFGSHSDLRPLTPPCEGSHDRNTDHRNPRGPRNHHLHRCSALVPPLRVRGGVHARVNCSNCFHPSGMGGILMMRTHSCTHLSYFIPTAPTATAEAAPTGAGRAGGCRL